MARGARAWDPDGVVTGRLEDRQWERTLFARTAGLSGEDDVGVRFGTIGS